VLAVTLDYGTMTEERSPSNDVQKLERELGMPTDWFRSLLKEESDWSFVIKLHALLEAALVHVINAKLSRPELRELVERLSMGGRVSKTAFGKALKVLEPKHERFIEALSSIRNDCIHDVRNVAFKFAGYVEGLEPKKQQRLLSTFGDFLVDEIPLGDKKIPRDDFVRRGTRAAFWLAATLVLAELYLEKELADILAMELSLSKGLSQFPFDEHGLLRWEPRSPRSTSKPRG
jgi:hypothetical protein